MKPSATSATFALMGLAVILLASGCEKTKADIGEDILTQMIELQEDTMEDFFDIVDDQNDICNKTVRDVRALVEQREGQMRTLAAQWEQLKANSSTKDQREAVNRVTPEVGETFQRLESQKDAQYAIFEEFQRNCANQTPDVFDTMKRAMVLFNEIIGHEFI